MMTFWDAMFATNGTVNRAINSATFKSIHQFNLSGSSFGKFVAVRLNGSFEIGSLAIIRTAFSCDHAPFFCSAIFLVSLFVADFTSFSLSVAATFIAISLFAFWRSVSDFPGNPSLLSCFRRFSLSLDAVFAYSIVTISKMLTSFGKFVKIRKRLGFVAFFALFHSNLLPYYTNPKGIAQGEMF